MQAQGGAEEVDGELPLEGEQLPLLGELPEEAGHGLPKVVLA